MKSFLLHILISILALVALLPFLWLIAGAFKTQTDIQSSVLPWDHLNHPTLANFDELLNHQRFWRWMVNSLFLASLQTVLAVILSSLAGFVLAKHRFFGRRPLMLVMLVTMLLPPQVLLPGSYQLIYQLGGSIHMAIVIPGAVSVFGIFLFRQSMQAIPDELLHSGRVDGCSELRLWWDIALPILRPVVGAFTLLSFLSSWNSFLWPQIVLQDESKYTLPLALNNLAGQAINQQHSGILLAATLLGVLPVTIFFFIVQRDFIGSLTSGAVKG